MGRPNDRAFPSAPHVTPGQTYPPPGLDPFIAAVAGTTQTQQLRENVTART